MNRALPTVLKFGLIAGLIIAIPMIVLMVMFSPQTFMKGGMLYGYTSMLISLSMVFLGVKSYRDRVLGGVIKFGPALLVGLGISAVASIIYAIGWEISLAASGYDFAGAYTKMLIDAAQKSHGTAEEIQRAIDVAEQFAANYRNPFYRFPMTFLEMFPVGILVSLIAAGVLRNSRVLPAEVPAT